MEIRARYILMGLFLLAVIFAGFGFVYWLHNSGGIGDRAEYRIRFGNSVSGLVTGAGVLFNGIRVGEVTGLYLSADRPSEVDVAIAVHRDTPIRADTQIDLDFQGLTGVAVVVMSGGSADQQIQAAPGEVPVLDAKTSAGVTMTQSARDALLKINGILEDNSTPFKELVANLNSFAGALSRNSDKVDGILGGLERMTGGARTEDSDKVFSLDAPREFTNIATPLKGQLVVPEPTAIIQLDTQNILFRPGKDDSPLPPGARWADNLSRLLQEKIVQSFENAGQLNQVSRNADAVTGDFQLLVDIRNFQLLTKPTPTAEVELSVKIADSGGKILDARIFHYTAPAKSTDTEAAVAAFQEALSKALTELVSLASAALATPA
jgi:phospholipid/cholesterol/gamma-HCH transport system substrate-binding protein